MRRAAFMNGFAIGVGVTLLLTAWILSGVVRLGMLEFLLLVGVGLLFLALGTGFEVYERRRDQRIRKDKEKELSEWK